MTPVTFGDLIRTADQHLQAAETTVDDRGPLPRQAAKPVLHMITTLSCQIGDIVHPTATGLLPKSV